MATLYPPHLALSGVGMRLTLCAPFAEPRHADLMVPDGWTLAQVCSGYTTDISGCMINGHFVDAWQEYHPQRRDHVTLYCVVQTGIEIGTAILYAAISAVVSTALSIAISAIIRALTPTPSNTAGKPEQIFGIAGLTNTVALGTPLFLVYGTRRIYGHIIATRTDIASDGKSTQFGILYFMGEGPIQAITDVQINDTPLSEFTAVQTQTRLGDGNTEAILDFNTVSQVWSDNRTLAEDTPIVYTTHGSAVERVTLIFATPGLFQVDDDGALRGAQHTIHIEYTAVSDGVYVDDVNSPLEWGDQTQAQRFKPYVIQFDHPDAWLIRVTLDETTNQGGAAPALYNVQEEASGDLHYPTSALLAITGIASNQITSFEGMRASGLVQGRVVRKPVLVAGEWDGTTYENAWTSNRAWVLRDLLTDARVGMGHRIPESLFDDDAAVIAANYWDTEQHGITIDQCDALINDRRVAWDWMKTLLTEGKATLIPSGGKLKLIVDTLDDPQLLYSMPGNIIEGSLHHSKGSGEGTLPNTILGQFPDAGANYMLQPVVVEAEDIGDEPTRSDLVTISTVTDVRRVYWMLNSQLKRHRLVQRHVTWQSPQTAMVSEPFDIVSLAYDTPDFQRGVSGFLSSDSTTTRLVLDRLVTLAPSTTYALMVRHQQTNTVERTTVATGAGTWGAIVPTAPLTDAPAPGDLWALGVQDTSLLTVQIESVALDDSGTYALTASEVVPSVYDYPAPPDGVGGGPSQVLRPLPLWAVSVTQGLALQPDGSYQQTLTFSVTPGLPSHSDVAVDGHSSAIDLSLNEPGADTSTPEQTIIHFNLFEYYKGATITLLDGTGAGQVRTITSYLFPEFRQAGVDPWVTEPDNTTVYQIDWPAYSALGGFAIERTETTLLGLARPFAFVAQVTGTEYTLPIDGTGGLAFRFTPVGVNGVHNQQGRWVAFVTVAGDVGAPDAPAEYGSGSSDG